MTAKDVAEIFAPNPRAVEPLAAGVTELGNRLRLTPEQVGDHISATVSACMHPVSPREDKPRVRRLAASFIVFCLQATEPSPDEPAEAKELLEGLTNPENLRMSFGAFGCPEEP